MSHIALSSSNAHTTNGAAVVYFTTKLSMRQSSNVREELNAAQSLEVFISATRSVKAGINL